MKDYTIWLKGGGVVSGTLDRDNHEYPKIPRTIKIKDMDGYVTVRGSQVQAIGIFNHTNDARVGFYNA